MNGVSRPASGRKKAGTVPTGIKHADAQRSSPIKPRRLKKAEREMDFFSINHLCRMSRLPILAISRIFCNNAAPRLQVKCLPRKRTWVRGVTRTYVCEKSQTIPAKPMGLLLVMVVVVQLRTGVARKIKIDVVRIVSNLRTEVLPRRERN